MKEDAITIIKVVNFLSKQSYQTEATSEIKSFVNAVAYLLILNITITAGIVQAENNIYKVWSIVRQIQLYRWSIQNMS